MGSICELPSSGLPLDVLWLLNLNFSWIVERTVFSSLTALDMIYTPVKVCREFLGLGVFVFDPDMQFKSLDLM